MLIIGKVISNSGNEMHHIGFPPNSTSMKLEDLVVYYTQHVNFTGTDKMQIEIVVYLVYTIYCVSLPLNNFQNLLAEVFKIL